VERVTDVVSADRRAIAGETERDEAVDRDETRARTLGLTPALAVCAAAGLLLITFADERSRAMTSSSQALFWIGILFIYGSIVSRLVHPAPGRLERLSLSALLGLALYLVKVFRDPFGFTFADELVHAPNAEAIVRTHHLFHENVILGATPSYPGLESVTAGLASLSGLSVYGAGLIVIGTARLLIVLALFLLVERLLGSARAAGIAVAVYAANSNFAFFSAQFSYESLALPLLVVVFFAYAEWRATVDRRTYSAAIVLLTFAIVVTHHLTSYALAVSLLVVAIAYRFSRSARNESPGRFAAFATVAAVVWLFVVATKTVGYLSPVVTRAVSSVVHTISGESAPRQLFAGKSGRAGSGGSNIFERGVALVAVALLVVLYPVGLRQLWREQRGLFVRDVFAATLALGGGLMFAMYALRFAPAAWETANRSSEFLFLGLAVVVPLGVFRLGARLSEPVWMLGATAVLTTMFAGGVVAGWTPSLRLSQPYEISAEGHVVQAEGRAMASWALQTLGPGRRYAGSEADARLLNTYADAAARAGQSPDMADILKSTTLASWELPLLRKYHVRYVVTDRRLRAFDNTAGYYFGFRRGPRRDPLLPPSVVRKWGRYDRIFDSGQIVIFDLRRHA
jgi:hypothetical protein